MRAERKAQRHFPSMPCGCTSRPRTALTAERAEAELTTRDGWCESGWSYNSRLGPADRVGKLTVFEGQTDNHTTLRGLSDRKSTYGHRQRGSDGGTDRTARAGSCGRMTRPSWEVQEPLRPRRADSGGSTSATVFSFVHIAFDVESLERLTGGSCCWAEQVRGPQWQADRALGSAWCQTAGYAATLAIVPARVLIPPGSLR